MNGEEVALLAVFALLYTRERFSGLTGPGSGEEAALLAVVYLLLSLA